jgi:hypothetical protein
VKIQEEIRRDGEIERPIGGTLIDGKLSHITPSTNNG